MFKECIPGASVWGVHGFRPLALIWGVHSPPRLGVLVYTESQSFHVLLYGSGMEGMILPGADDLYKSPTCRTMSATFSAGCFGELVELFVLPALPLKQTHRSLT